MKIVYNNIIPFKGFLAINLFGILFVRSEYKGRVTEKVVTHETIHTKQMKEMLYVFFYLWYIIEWLIRLCFTWNTHEAYRKISFEQEAYLYEKFPNYPNVRTHFNWVQFLF